MYEYGTPAIVMDVIMLAIGLFLFIGCLGLIVRKRGSRLPDLVGLGISLMFLLAISNLFLHEIRLHSDLGRLRAESVDRIEVGSRMVSDQQRVAEIVAILKRPEWFNKGRFDTEERVPFIIRFKDGGRREYRVTSYRRGVGVVLESVSPSGWNYGQVLYPELTAVLQGLGITLPPCLTPQGKPGHCAP